MKTKSGSLLVIILIFIFGITGAMAQPRVIKGTVYNSDGKPASGITVTANHTKDKFFTSFDGTYQLTIDAKSKYLKFKFPDREEKLDIEGNTKKIIDYKKDSKPELTKDLLKLEAAKCEALTAQYQEEFAKNPDHLPTLKKINYLLNKENCTESSLYADVAERLYKLDPNSVSAFSMARLSLKRNNTAKAVEFYEEAIKTEKVKRDKANYCYELALVIYDLKDYQRARTIARQAISLNSEWGKPYLLIGRIYAASAKLIGESDIQQRIVYCLAVDQFIKAKAIDSQCAVEANKEITEYSRYFPGKEDASFENIKAGSTFKVGGWINESTVVRVR